MLEHNQPPVLMEKTPRPPVLNAGLFSLSESLLMPAQDGRLCAGDCSMMLYCHREMVLNVYKKNKNISETVDNFIIEVQKCKSWSPGIQYAHIDSGVELRGILI